MAKLELSVAVGDYDRMRPLIDGTVPIDGVAPVFMTLEPEEIFFRSFRHAEFDIAELSLSSFALRTARGDNPYVGVPVFPSRSFRHSGVYIRTDRGIRAPGDLRGRKIGLAEYQLTANVWIRAFLEDDFGVEPASIHWVRGGIEQPGRSEKMPISLPAGVTLTEAPAGRSLSELLLAGEIDGLIGPRTPSAMTAADAPIGWLFPDPRAAAIEILPANQDLPDHARARRPAHPGRAASLAAGRRPQSVRPCEGGRLRQAGRHVREQGHAPLRGPAASGGPGFDGDRTSGPTVSPPIVTVSSISWRSTTSRACPDGS